MQKEEIKEMLSSVISQQIEVKAKLRMISYLMNAGKYVYHNQIDELLDKFTYLNKLEIELRKKLDEIK